MLTGGYRILRSCYSIRQFMVQILACLITVGFSEMRCRNHGLSSNINARELNMNCQKLDFCSIRGTFMAIHVFPFNTCP